MPTTYPPYFRTPNSFPIWPADAAAQALFDVAPQRIVSSELRHLRSLGTAVGVPLGGGGSILEAATTGCGVAAELT
jgi:hypothetical protein